MRKFRIISLSLLSSMLIFATVHSQTIRVKEYPAYNLKKSVPKGSYSGIAKLDGDTYGVVCDKGSRDGYFKFRIDIDPDSGYIRSVENLGFMSGTTSNRDNECIAYNPTTEKVYIGGERNNTILEYDLNGKATGFRSGNLLPDAHENYGIESLCYDKSRGSFWLMSESTLANDNYGNYSTSTNLVSNLLRLSQYDNGFKKMREYAYKMDTPQSYKKSSKYCNGVSDIAVLDDGRLLILEREAYVSKGRYGSWCTCKIYIVNPSQSQPVGSSPLTSSSPFMDKTLLWETHTEMSLRDFYWANYEGMCLGPKLSDGSQTLLLISDSEERYGGVLKDWLKVLVIKV